MPPGGPHFQPPYGGPPVPPTGPPQGYPQQGYPQQGYPQQGYPPPGNPQQGPPAGYPQPSGYPAPNGYPAPGPSAPGMPPGPTGTRQMPPAGPPSGPMGAGPMPPGMAPGYAPGMGPGMAPGMAHGMVPGYGPGALVIDVGSTDGKKAAIGAVVAGVVGLIAIVSSLAGAVDGGAGAQILGIVIGLLFLLPTILVIVKRDKVFRPRKLVFEPAGIRWDDPRGAPWAVPWSELAAVSVSKHTPMEVDHSLNAKVSGAITDKVVGERAHVRLDLYPADPSFPGRHPELAHLWERQGVRGGYRMPLGSNVKFIPMITEAMGRFAPQLFRGVQQTEGFMGLS